MGQMGSVEGRNSRRKVRRRHDAYERCRWMFFMVLWSSAVGVDSAEEEEKSEIAFNCAGQSPRHGSWQAIDKNRCFHSSRYFFFSPTPFDPIRISE